MEFLNVHPTWLPLIKEALNQVTPTYLSLLQRPNWLPGKARIFNAFSLPLNKTRYILFGESPYPRAQSANGYAFWDAAVSKLWSNTGLSKPVNRATSLRHIMKMLLIADGSLTPTDTSQSAIISVDKQHYVQTIDELFNNFLQKGFLLLNASLVLSSADVKKDAQAWLPFMSSLLEQLSNIQPNITLVLLGKIAKIIDNLPAAQKFPRFQAEHPYNISFIHNPDVINFFRPLHLLERTSGQS